MRRIRLKTSGGVIGYIAILFNNPFYFLFCSFGETACSVYDMGNSGNADVGQSGDIGDGE